MLPTAPSRDSGSGSKSAATQAEPERGVRSLTLRAFGLCQADLELDFKRTPRPLLETEILRACARPPDGDPLDWPFFAALEVGKRTEYLLTLALLEETGDL